MSASVLVVGGAGYIGSHMVKALHRSGHRVTTFDNLELGHRDAVLFGELIEGDLRDPASVRRAFTGRHFDVVMHFAAYAYVRESVESPQKYYGNNVVGAIHLLDAMLEHDVRRIVFSSSCATYGESDEPLSEAHPQAPINPYGFTKLIVERMLSDYAAPYRLRSIALRYFNAAGADREGELRERHEPEPHLIPLVLREACRIRDGGDHRAPKLEIYGSDLPTRDGTCVRDYVHVEDICAAHLLACERLLAGEEPLAESYNLGSEAGFR